MPFYENEEEIPDPYRDELIEIVRDGLWHSTTAEGFIGIVESGKILPSSAEREPFSYPQTENSYALLKGYVAVFDFYAATDEQIRGHYDGKWDGFFPLKQFSIALELDRAQLRERLIPNSQAKEEVGYKKMWIPFVEAWHPIPIPLKAISGALVLGWGEDGNKQICDYIKIECIEDLYEIAEQLKDAIKEAHRLNSILTCE